MNQRIVESIALQVLTGQIPPMWRQDEFSQLVMAKVMAFSPDFTVGLWEDSAVSSFVGGFALDDFNSGTSKTVTLVFNQTLTYATSTAAGNKSVTIPAAAAGNAGWAWTFKATRADGTVYTIAPTSGTIDGFPNYQATDTDRPSAGFVSDGSGNWMHITDAGTRSLV